MDDYQDLLKNGFIKKVNQVRQVTEQLAQQAHEIRQLMGDLAGMTDRSRGLGKGPGKTTGGSPEGLFGPAGFPYLLEEMERSLMDLEDGAGKSRARRRNSMVA